MNLNISNESPLYLKQDECFCSKLGLEVEDAKFNQKTQITQIRMICHLHPSAKVGQTTLNIMIF